MNFTDRHCYCKTRLTLIFYLCIYTIYCDIVINNRKFKGEKMKWMIGNIIINNQVVLAPMAGICNSAYRRICKEMGCGLIYAEMVSDKAITFSNQKTLDMLYMCDEERPIVQQIFGSDKESFVLAAKYIVKTMNPDIIDINMGCPVPNVIKSGEGCALMGDLHRASKIIKACAGGKRPVTVKFRTGLTESNMITAEFAKMCEDSGAAMITIHGRSRNMMYQGEPYYEQIQQAKAVVQIPVIANGGIYSVEDAEKMMKETGADGIMIGRYALENPYIFSELTNTPIKKSRLTLLQEQLALCNCYYDESFTLAYMKKITSYFMKKQIGTKRYKAELFQCGNCEEITMVLEKIFNNT